MANNKICVNRSCDRPALYYSRTLCQLHYRHLRDLQPRNTPGTNLSEWEWIKKELRL